VTTSSRIDESERCISTTPLHEGLRKTIGCFEQLLRQPGVREVVVGARWAKA
jgi:hypothetical protein